MREMESRVVVRVVEKWVGGRRKRLAALKVSVTNTDDEDESTNKSSILSIPSGPCKLGEGGDLSE